MTQIPVYVLILETPFGDTGAAEGLQDGLQEGLNKKYTPMA